MKISFKFYLLLIFILCASFSPGFIAASENAEDSFFESNFNDTELNLTQAEKAWLLEHPVIRVAGPKAYPPFHFYNEDNEVQGIGPDYVRLIFAKLGLNIEYEKAIPWPDVLEKARNHELDFIVALAKSPEREEYLNFSEPFLTQSIVIYTRTDAAFIGGLNDLHGKKVALVERNIVTRWLKRDGINVIPVMVDSPLDILKTVSLGKADASIQNLGMATYLIQKHGLSNLKIAAPTSWDEYQAYFGIRKDWPELVSILNKVLISMKPETKSDIRNKWIAVRYEYGLQRADIIKWALIVISPVILIALFFGLYNSRLIKEVKERKKAEAEKVEVIVELQEALKEVRQLSGLLPICANCKSIRDDKGYWKEVEHYLGEHSEVEFSHSLCPDCIKKLYPDLAEKVLKKLDKNTAS